MVIHIFTSDVYKILVFMNIVITNTLFYTAVVKCFVGVARQRHVHYSSLSCINECLTIDSGGYLCMNYLRPLIVAWLGASQRSRESIRLNRFAWE